MTTVGVLRTLIAACVDDERTLREALRFADTPGVEALERLATERGRFVVNLELLAGPIRRRPTGSFGQILRETTHKAWVTAAGPNSGDALATCRHSQARIEAHYDEAIRGSSLTGGMREVIAMQRDLIHDGAAELNRLAF